MEAAPVEEKKFKLFGKKDAPPKPIPKAEEPPKLAEEQTAQEKQINNIFNLMRLSTEYHNLGLEYEDLVQKEFINLLRNS